MDFYEFLEKEYQPTSCSLLPFSIIVPTYNASQCIDATCESILSQENVRFEAIFIDGESQDRTLDIIRSYHDSRMRIQSVPDKHLFRMINRGVAMAGGEYIQILLPGDTLFSKFALARVSACLGRAHFPDLFCTGSKSQGPNAMPFIHQGKLSRLRYGVQPTILEGNFFKRELFKQLGYFSTRYSHCADFDFLCRKYKQNPSFSFDVRVYIEKKPEMQTIPILFQRFIEMFQILCTHFGVITAFFWIGRQNIVQEIVKVFFHSVRRAFKEQ